MVSIILLNWNGKRFLAECIRSVRAQTYQDYELLIIDNCSTDGSQDILRQQFGHERLLLNQTNTGYCGGVNQGIRATTGDYVFILNPDVILTETFVAELVRPFKHEARIGIVTGKLLRFDRQTLDSTGQFLRRDLTPLERGYGELDRGEYDQPGYVFSACGAVVSYRRAMLDDIQLNGEWFDETYFAFYEDLDLGWRAHLFGWQAYYTPTAVACHYRGGGLADAGQAKRWFHRLPLVKRASLTHKPPAIQRHIIKNRYLTLLKNATLSDCLRGLPAILRFELCLWGYVLFVRPSLLRVLLEIFKSFPDVRRKRRYIQARHKALSQT
jgi:GT2 family glycosyltransferase